MTEVYPDGRVQCIFNAQFKKSGTWNYDHWPLKPEEWEALGAVPKQKKAKR